MISGISKVFQGKNDESYYDGIKSGNSSDGQEVREDYVSNTLWKKYISFYNAVGNIIKEICLPNEHAL